MFNYLMINQLTFKNQFISQIIMLNCEFCHANPSTNTLTKCCKMFICVSCREKSQKKLNCQCGKAVINKKLCTQSTDIFEIIQDYYSNKQKQCQRCSEIAHVDCIDCCMLFCNQCNIEMHAKIGFAKHQRNPYSDNRKDNDNFDKLKRKQFTCRSHGVAITYGCECGALLCLVCIKNHRDLCSKGGKTKPLRQFKQQYFINVLLKMRQLTIYKQKLVDDKNKYINHFKSQRQLYESSSNVIYKQFQYIRKMIQVKFAEVKTKIQQYWTNCQSVYIQNNARIDDYIIKYNDNGKLIERFADNLHNLDYVEKRVKRFYINFDYCNFRIMNVDQVQNSILGINLFQKHWESSTQENIIPPNLQMTQRINQKEEVRLFGNNIQNVADLLFEYTEYSIKDRLLNLLPSHSQLYFSFIHLPYQNLQYEIEYGVGMKVKGQQIFKKLMNSNGYGIIEGLNPSTKYRIRMKVVTGIWGPITDISTLEMPRFNLQNNLLTKIVNQNSFYFLKAGTIYGFNEINFGVHRWIIKLLSKGGTYEESQTACISIGVSNKQTKKATFLGLTLNYGYQKDQITIKVILDCNERKLLISTSTINQDEIYQNLPNLPLFPTIQNKGNNQVLVKYNLTNDDNISC